jgi:hypothetical protein
MNAQEMGSQGATPWPPNNKRSTSREERGAYSELVLPAGNGAPGAVLAHLERPPRPWRGFRLSALARALSELRRAYWDAWRSREKWPAGGGWGLYQHRRRV